MSARSLNQVQLIGNLTRDPELRYTPAGTAVCSFGLATNRGWTTESGEKKEETEFHKIVSWNKLAELCSQLLAKGRKVYVEGRLQTRSWQAQDGTQKSSTEIVIEDMIILDSRRPDMAGGMISVSGGMRPGGFQSSSVPSMQLGSTNSGLTSQVTDQTQSDIKTGGAGDQSSSPVHDEHKPAPTGGVSEPKEDINPDDIPF